MQKFLWNFSFCDPYPRFNNFWASIIYYGCHFCELTLLYLYQTICFQSNLLLSGIKFHTILVLIKVLETVNGVIYFVWPWFWFFWWCGGLKEQGHMTWLAGAYYVGAFWPYMWVHVCAFFVYFASLLLM